MVLQLALRLYRRGSFHVFGEFSMAGAEAARANGA
jgi:hypothetical protein